MRGGSDLFSTSTYVLMDYRSLVGVGLNTFDATATALNTIDIERVEAVRGPGSALWDQA
jgi:outer membrane receptor protein involved in Fe transport